MDVGIGIVAIIITAVLGGMRIVYGIDAWKEEEHPFYRVWIRKDVYIGTCFWLILLGMPWLVGVLGGETAWPLSRYLQNARLADLLATYGLLALIDVKRRIVLDRVLICYLSGQMLLGGAYENPEALMSCFIGGMVFAGAAVLFTWMSKGRIGMGDAKLLGVTAMTAGVMYTIQIVCMGLIVSFFYSLWLVLFRKRNTKSEIPFVPFLALGMVMNTMIAH